MIAAISEGHFDLADFLFLLAAILFVLDAVLTWAGNAPAKLKLTSVGLALVALGWFVL